jgi:PAS domain S-box-containing protein
MNALRHVKSGPALVRHELQAACRVFEISADLLGSASVDGYLTSLNPAWERTLGFSREALMGQPFIEFIHPADRAATLAELEGLSAGAETAGFENRFARKQGGWCWLSWQAARRAGELYFVGHDVTAQVAAAQRRHMLTNLVEGIDDAILTKTTDMVITSWNLAAEWMYGFTADEAIGRSMLDLIVPQDRAHEPETIVRRLLEGEGVRQYTTQRQRKDGTMLAVSLTASLLRDDEHKVLGVAVVSRDISELSLEDTHVRDEIDTLAWVGRIRDAIDEDRIVFHAQPIVSLRGEPTSYELLCRLTGRDGELVSPARFLPVAENYGLIVELDLLAVNEAAAQITAGHEVSINLSTATVGRRHIVDVIAERLLDAGADPSKLTLEITETALMKDIVAAQRFAAAVADLGCRLALDDFGTGFGGFTYLKKLQIDRLKIDVEFVRDLPVSSASQHVVKAVVSLAKAFSLDTVAEGVEDEQTLALLEEMGVSHVQGYHLARPAPTSDVLEAHDER